MSAIPLASAIARPIGGERLQENAPPAESMLRLLWPVAVATLIAGGAAVIWAYFDRTLLAYGDAQIHLAIARRVLDSRTPSLAQLGTVWLPLPHVLLMLFVYVDPLWRTGLAGSILGVACLVVTACSLFLSVRLVTGRRSMAWVAVAVLLTNPNVLYIHTTALTEPVLIASMTAATYYLLRWGVHRRWPDLITGGALAAAAVMSRYEGWAFAVACAALVSWMAYFATLDARQAEGATLAYLVPPVYGMGLWFFYNWIIFGDPLSFEHGQYSALARAATAAVPTKGNIVLSLLTYSRAAMDTLGLPLLLTALLGLLVFIARTRLSAASLMPLAYVSLYCFGVLLLFLGQIEMITPQSTPQGMYNIRYSLPPAPGVAFFIAYLGASLAKLIRPGFVVILAGVLLASQAFLYAPSWPRSLILVEEGLHGTIANPATPAVAAYMRSHYDGGGILVDESEAGWMTPAGIHLKEYVGSFSGQLFLDTLNQPAEHVKWVVTNNNGTPDRIGAVLLPSPFFQQQFRLVQSFEGVQIFERRDGGA